MSIEKLKILLKSTPRAEKGDIDVMLRGGNLYSDGEEAALYMALDALAPELIALWEADITVASAWSGQDWTERKAQCEALDSLNSKAKEVLG